MATSVKKQLRTIWRNEEIKAARLIIRFNKSKLIDLTEMLLSRSIKKIDEFLLDMLIIFEEAFPPNFKEIKDENLYAVFAPLLSEDGLVCVLGKNISAPYLSIPTINQIREMYTWHRKWSTFESQSCENIDMWVEYLVGEAIKDLEFHKTLLSAGLIAWEDVLVSNKGELQSSLRKYHLNLLAEARKEIKDLKRKDAPTFMILDCARRIQDTRKITHILRQSVSC